MSKETSKSIQIRNNKNHFEKYFSGKGIDIGAGDDPLSTPFGTVDVFDIQQGDAQYLNNIDKKQYDFVYSSHCLEHLNDISFALKEWCSILKDNSFLYIVLPDWSLYEHEIWPSKFNNDHKFTFSLTKTRYDVHRMNHYHLLDLVSILSNIKLVEYGIDDFNFDYSLPNTIDQTNTNALCQIYLVFKK